MKRFFVLPTLLAILCLHGCSSTKQSIPDRGTITGRIFVIGNEPFTKLAVQSSEGIMYPLKCNNTTEQELRKKQGRVVRIEYNDVEQAPDGSTLKVTRAEISAE